MPANFISDGFTQNGIIEATEWFDEFRYTCRPATSTEVATYSDRINSERKGAVAEKISAEFVVEHLVNWDLTDQSGKPVELSVDNCLRLNPRLFAALSRRLLNVDPHVFPPEEIVRKNS